MAPSSPLKCDDAPQSAGPVKANARRPNYRRRVKPPQTFAELITVAIKESQTGKLTLKEIQNHMAASHDCFRGSYVGWKNSVRHNLSTSPCFVKVLKNKAKPHGKDNFWALNPGCPHCLVVKAPRSPQRSGLSEPALPDTETASRSLHKSPPPSTTQAAATTAALTSVKPAAPSTAHPAPLSGINGGEFVRHAAIPPVYQHGGSQNGPQLSANTPPSYTASSATSLPTNEWNFPTSDLYVPDGDIDLSLYGDDVWPSSDSRQSLRTSTVHSHLQQQGDVKPNRSWMRSDIYPQYHSLSMEGGLPPTASRPQSAKIRIESEYVAATHRHHPYRAGQAFGSFRDARVDRSCYSVPRREPGHHYGPRFADGSRAVPNSPQGGSVVASAIRSSLGVDLDEMALYAIERSVRVLDVTRPCDLMSA